MEAQSDIVVVGSGIAGASAAAELSVGYTAILVEQEERYGSHASGPSAALVWGVPLPSGLEVHGTRSGRLCAPPRARAQLALPTNERRRSQPSVFHEGVYR